MRRAVNLTMGAAILRILRWFRDNAFVISVLGAFTLIAYGLVLIPTTSTLSVIPVSVVLSGYALIWLHRRRWLGEQSREILAISSLFGLSAGAVFVAEILLEYLILPNDNSPFGIVEFSVVFLVFTLAGTVATHRTGSVRAGVTSAVGTALISSLIWYLAVLTVFYCFFGTVRQHQVILAEGNYDDFTRSGMHDFNAFILEDFLGAGFFHLLLGPLIASILGLMGGLVGKCLW